MAGQKEAEANAAVEKATRQRSSIAFPYMDLKSAIELAEAIHGNVGLGECDDTQLAAWSNQSAKSSTFRVQVYAARTFGILEGEGGRHKLSEIGRAVVDPNQARQAKARAFLTVPLFKAIYEKYKGGVLPPAAALERDIVALGVAEKQKARARNIFEKSAEQSGFFESGKNHLVMPGSRVVSPGAKGRVEKREGEGRGIENGGGGGGDDQLDPVIEALVQKLPKGVGAEWPLSERVRWLKMMSGAFNMAYTDAESSPDESIEIKKTEAAN